MELRTGRSIAARKSSPTLASLPKSTKGRFGICKLKIDLSILISSMDRVTSATNCSAPL